MQLTLLATNLRRAFPVLLALLLCQSAFQGEGRAEESRMKTWKKYGKTKLFSIAGSKAYCYVTDFMTIDADGAPNAYHPRNTGLDHLKHAGYPGTSWWKDVLVSDPANPDQPFVMTTGRYAGYYLSMTALKDHRLPVTDPRRYVDATRVPYVVFPVTFSDLKGVGALGDIGVAVNLSTGERSSFVVGDIGPRNHPLGEVSIRLAERLGGREVSARTGPGELLGEILYIVFPGSGERHPWPQSTANVERIAGELLASLGGMDAVLASVGRPADLASFMSRHDRAQRL